MMNKGKIHITLPMQTTHFYGETLWQLTSMHFLAGGTHNISHAWRQQ